MIAEEVSKKTGVNRRQFIAGTAALGAASGLKGVGDLLPPTKGVVKAAAKTAPSYLTSSLNLLKAMKNAHKEDLKYIKSSNLELKNISKNWDDLKDDYPSETIYKLSMSENLAKDTLSQIMNQSVKLIDEIADTDKKDLLKLDDEQLKSLRDLLTSQYSVPKFHPDTGATLYDSVDFNPKQLLDAYEERKLSINTDPQVRKYYQEQLQKQNTLKNKINEVLEKKGLTTISDIEKSKSPDSFKIRLKEPDIERLKSDAKKLYRTTDKSTSIKEAKEAEEKNFRRLRDIQTQKTFNKGGMSMEQQMSLFEEGGMKDDGLDRDPVSGNDIPPGSLAKEVRDDIPAQLSDGEYVVPADVVQYYGVKFFEDIRAEAKRGLAEMEATGRIGGEPVEVDMTMIAFGQAKEEEEKKKKAQGGLMGYSNGGTPTVDDDYFKQQAIAKANPTSGFQRVGQSLFGQTQQGNVPMPGTILITKTFYHPDGRIQAVQGTMRGNPPAFVPNQGFDQFTKAPWSETPPAQTQATTKKQERDDSKDPQFTSTEFLSGSDQYKGLVDKDGKPVAVKILDSKGRVRVMTPEGYNAVVTSANRLGLDADTYYNLPFNTKRKLAGQELKSIFGGKVDDEKVDEILADSSKDGEGFFDQLFNGIVSGFKKIFGIEDTDTTPIPTPTEKKNNNNQNNNEKQEKEAIENYTSRSGFGESNINRDDDGSITIKTPGKSDVKIDKDQADAIALSASQTDEYDADSFSMNKGGLATKTKPKPKTRKPRGKGLGNKK